MRKKLLSVLLALSMVLALAPVSVLASGTIGDPAPQTVVVRGDGPEDDTPNAKYGEAYAKAGLTLSRQAADGSYTLTIEKNKLQAVVDGGKQDETYKILENTNNPHQLWFGMEYKKPGDVQGITKAKVQFDGTGVFGEVELDNESKDGFYNYIKVYKADADGNNGEIGPVESESALIEWMDDNNQVLAVTKAVIKVKVEEPQAALTIGETTVTGPFFNGDTVVKGPEDLGNFTFSVSGDSVSVKGTANHITNWEKFSSIPEEQSGGYLPLQITADRPCTVIVKGSKETKIPFTEDYLSDTLIMRLDALNTQNKKTFTITVDEGEVYTVDFSNVELLPGQTSEKPTLSIAIPPEDEDLVGQTAGDLFTAPETGEAITVGTPLADGKIPVTVRGTVEQVNWPEFGEEHKSEEMKSGYYLPLKLTPTPVDCELKVTKGNSTDDFGVMTDPDDDTGSVTLTTWLNGLEDNGYKFEITVSKDGQGTTYEVDCSRIIPGYIHTVAFNSQDGSEVDSVEVKNGETVIKPTDPTKEGYTFGGWYEDADCTEGKKWNFETDTVTADITLYAKWTAAAATKYTVTFDSQGGSPVPKAEVASGGKVTKPSPDPTKANSVFGGWFKEADCTNAWNFDSDTVTEDIKLYAKWTAAAATKYTVTFDSQGGSPVPKAEVASGGKVTKPSPDPTKEGYTFGGWYKDKEGKDVWDFDKDTVQGTITLYAKWTKADDKPGDDKDKEYTVTFDSQGGTDVKEKEVKVKSGEKVQKPDDPTRDGYSFEGWFLKDAEKAFDFDTAITADINLYAKWTKVKDPEPSDPKDEYMISVRPYIRHGTVEVSHWYAEPGEWVTITLYPDTDYQVDWVKAVRENGGWISLSRNGRRYYFVMPDSDVVIDAGFDLQAVYNSYSYYYYQPVETAASRTPSTPVFPQSTWRPAAAMKDVPANSWAYAPAQWAYQNGYLDMASDGTFRLNDPVSHRQMWKIMAQWLNAPAMDDRALTNWAMQNGAAAGNLAGGSMTRQNVVTYLHQCCFLMGGDMSASGNLGQYPDARLITSASSQKAWTWAVSKGIISGTSDGYLNPNGVVSRGEFAAILMRLSQNVMK